MLAAWKARARTLKLETHALALACRDPRVPWYVKAIAGFVVAYALSPIDLIPDVIPVLGHADDLLIVPLGVLIARRLIPEAVLADCRARAAAAAAERQARRWTGAAIVVAIWLGVAGLLIAWLVPLR